jgi:autotransporter adhesin
MKGRNAMARKLLKSLAGGSFGSDSQLKLGLGHRLEIGG